MTLLILNALNCNTELGTLFLETGSYLGNELNNLEQQIYDYLFFMEHFTGVTFFCPLRDTTLTSNDTKVHVLY